MFTIRLCGGPGDGRVFALSHLPPLYHVVELISSRVDYSVLDRDPSASLFQQVDYHRTHLITSADEHLYFTRELLGQVQQAVYRNYDRVPPVVRESYPPPPERLDPPAAVPSPAASDSGEGDLDGPINTEVWSEPVHLADCAPASMRGPDPLANLPKAKPWSKNDRHGVDKLLDKIDEVIDNGT